MHRFKAAQGLEIDAVVAHGEVLALDEHVAQVAGQVTLFKIRLVVGALREQNHSRIIRGLRRQRRQRRLQAAEKPRQPMDVSAAERFRQRARGDQPVGQRVTRPGRNLRAIGHHPPPPIGRTGQISRVKMKKRVPRRTYAAAGTQEIGLGKNQRRGQRPRADQFLRPVTVGQDLVDERGTLHQARFQRAPFLRPYNHRNGVQLPGLFKTLRAGLVIDVVSHPLLVEEAPAGFPAALEFRRAELLEGRRETGVVRAHLAVRKKALIETAGSPRISREQVRGRRWLRHNNGFTHVVREL